MTALLAHPAAACLLAKFKLCVLKLLFDPSTEEVHTPLDISAGIVRIQKWKTPQIRDDPQCPVLLLWTFNCVGWGSTVASCAEESEYSTFLRDDSLVTTPVVRAASSVRGTWFGVFPALRCGQFAETEAWVVDKHWARVCSAEWLEWSETLYSTSRKRTVPISCSAIYNEWLEKIYFPK